MKRDRITLFIALLAAFGALIATAFVSLIIAEPI